MDLGAKDKGYQDMVLSTRFFEISCNLFAGRCKMVYKLKDVVIPTRRGIKVKKVRVGKLNNRNDFFDDSFPDGVFVKPRDNHRPRTKLRPMLRYCKEHGKNPEELTKEEIEQFTIYP